MLSTTRLARRALRLGAALLLTLASAASAQAGRTAVNVDENNVAIRGYDPVAYFTDTRATPGSAGITAVHEGTIYRFASARNRDRFKANTAKYLPQYGGYCAMGVALGKKLDADPTLFKVVDDKLYLNVNADAQKTWLKSPPKHIAAGNEKWATVRGHAGFDTM